MMKSILLAGGMLIAAPVSAQQIAPTQPGVPNAQTAPASPGGDLSQQAPVAVEPSTAPTQQAAEAGQVATGEQIAQIVEAEFPKYDKQQKGELTEAQFSEWMVALRSASEPGVTGDKPEVKSWVRQAFASADTDQSKKVSKAELTSFLSKGAG